MTTVLDASSILRYLDNEAGAERIAVLLEECLEGKTRVLVSSVQWGEIASLVCKRRGTQFVDALLAGLLVLGVEVIPATQDRSVRSGIIHATKEIPYADCFAVELAENSSDYVLITADFDVKPAEGDVRIEFLPVKSQPN